LPPNDTPRVLRPGLSGRGSSVPNLWPGYGPLSGGGRLRQLGNDCSRCSQ
jgi:hypothetical protein